MSNTSLKVRYVWWYRNRHLPIVLLLLLMITGCIHLLNMYAEEGSHHISQQKATYLKYDTYIYVSLLVLFTLLFCWVFLKWIRSLRYHWKIEPNGVSINYGFIYQDSFRFISSDKIYEAVYYRSAIGKFFNVGYVEIRKNDGVSLTFRVGPFTNVDAIVQAINEIAMKKNAGKQVAQTTILYENHQISKAEELEKLIELKSQGKISDEEYNELKSKLFG